MSDEYVVQLCRPAWLKVTAPDGVTSFRIDVYEAWRFLEAAKQSPSEDARWKKIIKYLSEKFGSADDQVSESMARDFADHVYSIGASKDAELKKKLATVMQSSQNSMETDCQPAGSTGPNDSSEPTLSPSPGS